MLIPPDGVFPHQFILRCGTASLDCQLAEALFDFAGCAVNLKWSRRNRASIDSKELVSLSNTIGSEGLQARAADIIEQQLGERRPLKALHNNNWVFITADEQQPYLVKFVPAEEKHRLEVEAGLHKLVRAETDVPVPELLSCDPEASYPYLVREVVPGQTLAEGLGGCSNPEEILRQAGTHLAQLHTIRFDNKGLIQADGSVKECAVFSGREHVRFLSILEETEVLKAREAELLRAVDVDRFYTGQPNVFCHCDYTPNNIIVEGGAVVSIIDFEWASAAPCMDDLATFDLFADINRFAQYKPGFFRGYRNVRHLPEGFIEHLDFYRYYRLVTMLSYQLRANSEGFDRKLQERMLGELAHVLQHGSFLTEPIHLAYGRVADEDT